MGSRYGVGRSLYLKPVWFLERLGENVLFGLIARYCNVRFWSCRVGPRGFGRGGVASDCAGCDMDSSMCSCEHGMMLH